MNGFGVTVVGACGLWSITAAGRQAGETVQDALLGVI